MKTEVNGTSEYRNQQDQRLLRILPCRLDACGKGVILFGIWSIIKAVTFTFFDSADLQQFVLENSTGSEEFYLTYFLAFLMILLFDLFPRFCVGSAAIREGRSAWSGSFRSRRFIPGLSIFMMFINLLSVIFSLKYAAEGEDLLQIIVSILVDIISFFMVFELMTSHYRLKKLLKAQEGGTASCS